MLLLFLSSSKDNYLTERICALPKIFLNVINRTTYFPQQFPNHPCDFIMTTLFLFLYCDDAPLTHEQQLFHTAILSSYTESLPSGKDKSCLGMCVMWNKTHGNRLWLGQGFGLMHIYYSKMQCYLVIGQISLH